jgi:proteasome lid subunit RPN8/RPN11
MRVEKDIKLILSPKIHEGAINCVEKASPHEACGLIFGKKEEIKDRDEFFYYYRAKRFECIESNKKSPVAFLIDNLNKLNEIYSQAHKLYNMNLLSIFHSHPGASNYPSNVDKVNMERLEKSGLNSFKGVIWSIMASKNNELRAFMFLNNEFIETELTIENI